MSVATSATPHSHQLARRSLPADDDGSLKVSIFTQEGDGAGGYTVNLLDEGNSPLAADTFTVLEPTGRDGVVRVTRDGATYSIAIADVKPS